jgi:hypothetical protein
MPVYQHQRSGGKQLVYDIEYDDGEYFITREGEMKKAVPDAIVAGVLPSEASARLMLRMAISDIEALIGMEE